MNTFRFLFLFILIALLTQSFCGFYVARADTKLYNKQSEVILVRSGQQSTVTMNSDFDGEVKDFAIVIPVPELIKEENIKVVKPDIFDKLNQYSEPRLVEYFDEDPCIQYNYEMADASMITERPMLQILQKNDKVKIEAQYKVGEYDIMILSSTESTALQTWLNQNGYKIPENAEEVLEPYIKNKLKFFVVKVDVEEMHRLGREQLSPIQITYNSDRFMLPIRLGMANAEGPQDMVVYAFTRNGRIECTNYRTAKIPTDKEVPLFIKDQFGKFYADLFKNQYEKKGKDAIFLEYAWDLSSDNWQKCDPCATTPPTFEELKQAGVFFINYSNNNQISDYVGDLFFTRLHVRYDRENFPMDLEFQETPNQENFQGRYIITHPITSKIQCQNPKDYYKMVLERRENELDNLAALTSWEVSPYSFYLNEYRKKLGLTKITRNDLNSKFNEQIDKEKYKIANLNPIVLISLIFLLIALLIIYRKM